MSPREFLTLLRQTFAEWNQDKASRLAAALAYYTLFSLAPLLVVLIITVGLVLGEEAAQGQLVGQIEGTVGPDAAELIEGMVEAAGSQRAGGVVASLIGLAALIMGALGVFGALQDALNTIWGVQQRPADGILDTIKAQARIRATSFAVVLLVGLLLISAFIASTALSAAAAWFGDALPGITYGWFVANFLVSFAIITALFAIIYQVLPDVDVSWSDVWIGAAATALLFVVGKELIGLYLSRVAVGSIYGAAGSLVVVLVWIYYSAQILLLGAEFTQVYANKHGSRFRPVRNAVLVNPNKAPHGDEGEAQPQAEPVKIEAPRPQRAGLAGRLVGAGAPLLIGALLGWTLSSMREPGEAPGGHRGRPADDDLGLR